MKTQPTNKIVKLVQIILIITASLFFLSGCKGKIFETLLGDANKQLQMLFGFQSDTTAPSVSSVSSTSINQVRVEFSEAIDATSALNVSNYTIDGLTIISAILDSNPSVVRLTTENQSNINYDITITASVEDNAGNEMDTDYSGSFAGSQDAPRISNVTTTSCIKVRIEFSEEVEETTAETAGNYTLSPSITVNSAERDPGGAGTSFVDLTLGADMLDTNYTVTVSSAVLDIDTGGNGMDPYFNQKSFAGDARPKVSLLNSASTTTARLTFTEDVDQTEAEKPANYLIDNLTTPAQAITVTGAAQDVNDNSIVLLTFSVAQLQGENYKITIDTNIIDKNNNHIAVDTFGYFIGNGPPAVIDAQTTGLRTITVTFSEPIRNADRGNAETTGHYSIPGLIISGASVPRAGNFTTVNLTLSGDMEQQIYTITLTATLPVDKLHAFDDDATIDAGYNSVSFQGDGRPKVLSAESNSTTQVKVVFSESVDLATSQTSGNYSITSAGYPTLTITGASRNPEPNSNEVILTTSGQLYVNYTVTVTGVKDTTNNTISGNNTYIFAGTGTDNTPPSILCATATSTSNLRVYFNEDVDETTSQQAVNYTLSTLSTSSITVSGTPGDTQTLQVSVPNSSTGTNSITVTARGSENLGSYEFKRDAASKEAIAYSIVSAINANSQSPVWAYLNYVDTGVDPEVELVSRTYGANGDITVDDSLITNVAESANNASTVITSVSAPTIDTPVRSSGNSAQVDIPIINGTLSAGQYQLAIANVEDTATPGNAISSETETIVVRVSETVKPSLMGVFSVDKYHVKLLFNESVDLMSSIDSSNYCIERELSSFNVQTGNGTSLKIDYNDGAPKSFTITGGGTENIEGKVWDITGNTSAEAASMANVLNRCSTSPFYAHSVGSTVYLSLRSCGSGTIDLFTATGFTINNVSITSAVYANNLTITGASRNSALTREVFLTLSSSGPDTPLDNSPTHLYGITATGITDVSIDQNTACGGTRAMLPISSELTAPTDDTSGPEIFSIESLSDGLVRVLFNEPVTQATAENTSNYSISPTLAINTASLDASNSNIVILYTDKQSALKYTLSVNGVQDDRGNSSSASSTFTGLATNSVSNGPVGNTIGGIGNLNNDSILSMIEFNNKLYVATFNSGSGEFLTEVYASDSTGVYFSQVNNNGFSPPTTFHKQRQTTSFAIFGGNLWASTADTPSEKANLLYTPGTTTPVHNWTQDTSATDLGNQSLTKLLNFGIATPYLYFGAPGTGIYYRTAADNYTLVSNSFETSTFTRFIEFGGRMYVGTSNTSGMMVFRSQGANADAPRAAGDFEKVIDASNGIGMDGYNANHARNVSVTSMEVFNGYIYVGTLNCNDASVACHNDTGDDDSDGAQVWRSGDGLTWELVHDFSADITNMQISSMKANNNYLYIGTNNVQTTQPATGAEAWRTPDGVSWEQYGSDGFGTTDYTDIPSMCSFLDMIYFGLEDTSGGGVIFRGSN